MSRRITLRTLSAVGCFALAAIAAPASAVPADLPADLGATTAATETADGSHTVTLDLVGDTFVSSSLQTTSQSTSPELRVGSNNLGLTKSRSYLDFDYAPLADIPADAVIASAELTLSNFATGSCSGTPIRAARITGAWTLDGLKWSAQPSATTAGWASSTAAFGANACPDEGDVTFDVKGIVSDWIGGAPERGILIKADRENAVTGYRKYRSAENDDAAKAPTLTITYGAAPGDPTDLTVTPGANGYATSLTPTLSATVTDADGSVAGYFEVRKGTTALSPIVWTGTSDPVDSGEAASVTVPEGVLLDNTIYSVVVWGDDGALRSATPIATAFKTDVTAPTVAITSDKYTDDEWRSGDPVSTTFTFDGPTDTAGFHITTDGTEYVVGTNRFGGNYAVSWKPTPGWHVITAVPVDKAGNEGAEETFTFGVGAPEFASPAFWEASAADFAVDISAPAGATGATLEWQVAGEKIWHTAAHLVSGETAWDGSVIADGGRSTTGPLTWHATAETLGAGTLTAPALVLIHGCFHYADAADKCTADRFVQLVEDE